MESCLSIRNRAASHQVSWHQSRGSRGPSEGREEVYMNLCKSASMIVAVSTQTKHGIRSGVQMLITSWTPPAPPVKDYLGMI